MSYATPPRRNTKFGSRYVHLTRSNLPQNAWKWQKSALSLKWFFCSYLAQNGVFWPKIEILQLSSFFHLPQTANSYLSSFSRYLSWKLGSQIFLSVLTLLVFISYHQFSFKRKVAMGLQLNNSWCVGQIPIVLYIFGFIRALGVHLYQFWDNIWWSIA